MKSALRHAWAVFAALAIAAVALCAGWLLAMRVNPALADVGMGDLVPLLVATALMPVVAGLALAAAVARRLVEPGVETGVWAGLDLARRPALAAVLAALVAGAFGFADQGFAEGAAVAGVALPVVFLVLAGATLVVRRIPLPALTAAFAVVAIAVVLVFAVAESRGRERLAALRVEALREVALLRESQQKAVRPVPREPGLEANAVDGYQPLIEAQRAWLATAPSALVGDLAKALSAPAEPFPASVVAALDRARPDLRKLREATRSRRAVWPIAYEKSIEAPLPYLLGVRVVAQLAILEGHECAAAGDVVGAAERSLDVLRFGADFGGGPLLPALIGTAVERMAVEALARLVRSPLAAPVLGLVDDGLARLQPALIAIGPVWRSERLLFAAMGPVDDPAHFADTLGGLQRMVALRARLVPWNAYAADAVQAMNRTLRPLEAAAAAADPAARAAALDAPLPATSNFIHRMAAPGVARTRIAVEEVQALAAAVRVAIGLERRFAGEGRYPEDPGPLPADPGSRTGAPMKYRLDAAGARYVLYGLGFDREDGGGQAPGDTVLPAGAWPEPAVAAQPRSGARSITKR